MDPRSPYHHQTRYVANRPPPPPPAPFPENHNFYRPHQANLLGPPLRPPAPPPSYRPVAVPLSINPQNSQFTYNPIHDNYHPRSHPDHQNFTQSHRILHPTPRNDDFPRRLNYDRENRPDPHRVLPDNWPPRSHPAVSMDPESYRRQLDKLPVSSAGRMGPQFEGNSRFIEDSRKEPGSGQFGSSYDRSSRDLRVLSNHARGYDSNSGNYDSRRGLPYDHDGGNSHQRWFHDKEVIRDARDFIEKGRNDIGDGDGIRLVSGKRELYNSGDPNVELERHNTKGSREGSHELSYTPRKQIQKKSAFLRIQKPYWNKEEEKVQYSGYFDNAKSNSFRRQDQSSHSDHHIRDEVREGSPVELDVSFKSNSLVAKAIMMPSSNSPEVSDTKLTLRNSKIRKVLNPEKDNFSSSPIKPIESTVKSDNSIPVSNNAASSVDIKQSKVSKTASSVNDVHDSSPLPTSSGTHVLPGKSRMEKSAKDTVSNKGRTNAVPGKTSTLKVGKRKKIVKRVVKRVVNTSQTSSHSQPTKKRGKSAKAESFAHSPPVSSEANKPVSMALADHVDSHPCITEVHLISENENAEAKAKISGEVGNGANAGTQCVSNIKRKRSWSSFMSSSSHEETSLDGSSVNANSTNDLHSNLDSEKNFTSSPNKTTSHDIKNGAANEQFFQNGDSFFLKNNPAKESPQVMHSVEGNAKKTKIHEDPINSCNTTVGFDNGLTDLQVGITAFDREIVNASKQPCNQCSQSVEDLTVDRFPDSSFVVEKPKDLCLSGSGKTSVENGAHGVVTIMGSDNDCSNSEESNFCSQGVSDGMGKEPLRTCGATSLGNASIGESSTMVSIEDSENNKLKLKVNKEVGIPQLDLPRSEVMDMYLEPVDIVSTAPWVDTTLRLSFKEPNPTESTVSGEGRMNASLQSCTDGIVVFHQSNLSVDAGAKVVVSSSVNVSLDGLLPGNEEKRKFSPSQQGWSCSIASDINEQPLPAGTSTRAVESCSTSVDGLTQPEDEVIESGMDLVPASDLPHLLLENGLKQGCLSGLTSIRDISVGEGREGVNSCSTVGQLAVSKAQLCPLILESEQIANATPIVAGSCHQNKFIAADGECGEEERMDVDNAEEQFITDSGTMQGQIPSELEYSELVERFPGTDVENNNCDMKNYSFSTSNYVSSVGDSNGVSTAICGVEFMELVPDTLSNIGSPETLTDVVSTSLGKISIDKVYGDDKIPVEKPEIQGGSDSSAHTSPSQNAKVVLKSDCAEVGSLFTKNTGPLLSKNSKNTAHLLKKQPTRTVSRVNPGHLSLVLAASKGMAMPSHVTKPRTWHRAQNSSASAMPRNKALSSSVTIPTQRQLPKKVPGSQSTSYIRKGNSLVRKPIPVAAQSQGSRGFTSSMYQPNSSGTAEVKNNAGSDIRINVVDPPNSVRTGGMNGAFERPSTPPLPSVSNISNLATNSFGNCGSSTPAEPLHNSSMETVSDPMKLTESNEVPKPSEVEIPIIQAGQINNLECQNLPKDDNVVPSNVKSVNYVKRKSNQLIATSNSCALSGYFAHNTHHLFSDGYYRRRKNQLVRTSLESHVKHSNGGHDGNLNSKGRTGPSLVPSGSFSKRRMGKVMTKTCKPSKSSLVWTLHGAQLSKIGGDLLHRQKFLPYLFPWKRTIYRRTFMPDSASSSNHSSLSSIRKLLLLRKRDTIYTRSKNGFSLRKSKVLSVGGSSLKWSKSIERHSKKANEEATLAVAAAGKKRREQTGANHIISGTKNRSTSPRERVFRIGLFRYRMDSSRRTLQRISGDESSCFAASKEEKDSKKSYVPRRLVIGKDEYVRIGNGNQLVRDPKKRTRILASEKVRWSLHTARSRLAKKRKYCQFFTRFGKCNKDDGKCPYIHDTSKIAVCTKFLNGLCFRSDCKLTHKVIPERMPDCSYFLQGLCTNRNCPYRHVHVNPNALTCQGFLRGYCADGNECRKKHTYVCPIYETTGCCPQGSKCKLHHPKNRSKRQKSKPTRENRNAQGRYFGSLHINGSEPANVVSEKLSAAENDNLFEQTIGDYIGLDISDEEAGESNEPMVEQSSFSDGDIVDMQLVDLDELIKPIRIMNI